MKKLFSIFAAVLVAGSMMAQRVTLDFSNAATDWGFPTDYVNADATYSNGTYTIGMVQGTAGSGWKVVDGAILYGKTNAALTLPAFDFAVSKIEVVGASGASANTVFNVFSGTTAVSTAVTGAKGTATFLINTASQAAGTVYSIKITSSHNNQISAIKIYEAVAGAPEAPTFSVAEGTYTAAQTVTLACTTEGAEIRYTLDGTEPTATSTLYATALTISETTTVKAVAVKNGVASAAVSATYTIIAVDGEGTQANPYTVADVKKLNNPGTTGVWVEGVIVGYYANNKPVAGTVKAVATNLAIATGTDTIPVALPNGDIRTALNVLDNPTNLGKSVKIKGDLVAYFSTTGVKNPTEYELETPTTINAVATERKAVKTIENGQVVIIRDGVRYNAVGAKL